MMEWVNDLDEVDEWGIYFDDSSSKKELNVMINRVDVNGMNKKYKAMRWVYDLQEVDEWYRKFTFIEENNNEIKTK